jgi:hypothetical protein
MALETRVTLQNLTIINGKATATQSFATAPAPCSQGSKDGQGGALYMRDGNLTVINSTFTNNAAAQLGPDTGGGAIYIYGSKHGAIIEGSNFTGNSGANAGAVGGLFAELHIYNSVFKNNKATGNGANNVEPDKCSVSGNQTGSGGNGGAIYQDGTGTSVFVCGADVENNIGGAGGSGLFMTSNDSSGTITIQDSIFAGNTGQTFSSANIQDGSVGSLGTAFFVIAKHAVLSNSTLQGL